MSNKKITNVKVVVKDGNVEKAIRKFKRICEKQGIKKQLKSRRYYQKPSEVRSKEKRKNRKNKSIKPRDVDKKPWFIPMPEDENGS